MKSSTVLLVAIMLLGTACKLEKEKPKSNDSIQGYRTGDNQRPARNFSSDEKTLGKRICRDLRFKRNQWETTAGSLNLRFSMAARTQCSGGLMNYTLNASLENSGADLLFDANTSSPFIGEVLTDLHPGLQTICDDLLNNESEVSNTVEASGSRYQTTFYEYQSQHYALVTRFVKDSDNVWRAGIVDESTVIVVERTSDSRLIGVVNRRVRENRCVGGSGSTLVQQSLTSIR